MTWTRLDDSFYDCPAIVKGGNVVAGAFARSLSYCGRHNTNGHVPKGVALSTICESKRSTLTRLLDLELWKDAGEDYLIPDYLDFNPSAEQVEKNRAEARERMRKLRANHR